MARRRRGASRLPGATLLGVAFYLALASGSCTSPPPPRRIDDLCLVLAQREGWWQATARAATRWGVAPGLLLAVIHQESGFRAEARGGDATFAPTSSAFGYSQATNDAWRDYQRATGRRGARRDDFADAVDFVGWYADLVHRTAGVAKADAYRVYLGYHEGPGGLRRGSHAGKPWLLAVARQVEARAARFELDAARCGRAARADPAAG